MQFAHTQDDPHNLYLSFVLAGWVWGAGADAELRWMDGRTGNHHYAFANTLLIYVHKTFLRRKFGNTIGNKSHCN